ncbi:Sterol regulatory element-binding protein ECM22-like protein 2 [Zalerion maritima]|uniref:Sterol regulatory element-binding protein ECM22-like protein 2 n=1 Tax=Zalerion maritima TaxID=339359 RepID=A0AAD5RS97_9PEZI|nr:Sterol regulatory element-binding protein ECM22-like protein 2 [Zalerion maritima]
MSSQDSTPPSFLTQSPSPSSGASFTFQASPSPISSQSPPVEKPYHTKRPHKKSRTGCRNCKARKVKCDEGQPSCHSCTLRKVTCVYPTPNTNSDSDKSLAVRSRSPIRSDSENLIVFRDLGQRPVGTQVDEMDMKLLWWYTTESYASFAIDGRPNALIETALKVQIVQLAFQHPFLMKALLGMTSLHLQTLDKDIPSVRALSYRAKAFEGFRNAVENPNRETYSALLACSLLLCGLSSQTFREPDGKPLYILDWMVVWRGIGIIVDMTKPKILLESGLKQLFFRPKINLDETVSYIPNRLLFMAQSIPFTDPDHAFVDTYYTALKYLGSLYKELQTSGFGPILDLRVITFFTFLPQAYVDLARAKRPRALVILAHYLMFIGHVVHVWWVQNIGTREITNISSELGSEWAFMLETPLATVPVPTENQIERARIILENQEWVPPKGGRYDPDDKRLQEICWVNDRGREVVLETGEVIIPRSPTFDEVHQVEESNSEQNPLNENESYYCERYVTEDGEPAFSNDDDERPALIVEASEDDKITRPIPFYTRI